MGLQVGFSFLFQGRQTGESNRLSGTKYSPQLKSTFSAAQLTIARAPG